MRALIQRVQSASVSIDNKIHSSIEKGLLIFIGIEDADSDADINWLVSKMVNLRIFNDADGVMNLSVKEIGGEVLIVSQFTLHASTKKGNRPSYIKAARPEIAIPVYQNFLSEIEELLPQKIFSGVFGADMKVSLINDGPVTIMMDSKIKD